MKSKKLPIFLEITRNSFLIILLILATNTIVQVVTFGIFSDEYEAKY